MINDGPVTGLMISARLKIQIGAMRPVYTFKIKQKMCRRTEDHIAFKTNHYKRYRWSLCHTYSCKIFNFRIGINLNSSNVTISACRKETTA